MLENQANIHSTSHHTEGLPPLWPLMETFGVTVNQCLEGTGLTMDQAKGYQAGMTPEQEFALYRNLLRLSGDAMLGLKLGELYHPQSYGMYGYAMLSARNVKMLVEICSKFHDLSFSHFKFRDALDEIGGTRLEFRYPLPQELIQVYSDRDIEAGFNVLQSVGLSRSVIKEIHLAYVDDANHEKYEKHFDCPIVMGQPCNAFLYDSSLLDQDLPWSPNQRTVDACLESCRELLNEIRRNNNFSAKIVDQIISNPRKFPSIVEIAQELSLSTRSLRRKLQHEGTSYQDILKEVRLKLAKQYLKDSFTVEQTADLLGYSESSAFSRAFKSWTGRTPQDYRISSMSSS